VATHVFDLAQFQARFPDLATSVVVTSGAAWDMAAATMSPDDGPLLTGTSLQLALELMTAHIAKSFAAAGASQPVGVVTGATEGSVSVSLAPPPARSGWQHWLSTTPYGLQLWALLQVQSAGGLYVGGSLERAAFRKAGGVFL
jgi:hypothetical protein